MGPIDPSANITVAPAASGTTVQLTDGGNLSSEEISLLGEASISCTLSNVTQLTLNGSGTPSTGVPFWNSKANGLNTLTATPAAMTATFSGLPSSLQPGQTAQGTLTCKNTGTGPDVDNATCVPSATGGTISNLQCSPATPAATLKQNQSIICTFDVTAPSTGPVNLQLTGSAESTQIDTTQTALDNLTKVPPNPTLEPDPIIWAKAQFFIGAVSATPVPTLGEIAMALLALGVAGGAAVGLRRKG